MLQKGASALKRVTENLVRLSLQVSAAGEVAFQGDPEPSVKQILNSVVACRTKLGLKTKVKITQKGSHSSNGQVEKAIDTLRRNALTLKTFAEDRAKVVLEGDHHIFGWLLRHAAFLHNRYFTGYRGIPAYEAMFGRRFKANLLPFGELCIYHAPSKYKGDLQWQRGLFVGLSEKNGANIVLTPDGAREARSVRRLPEEQQWDAKALVTYRGLPWDYGGTKKRKRPLYTSARVPLLPDNATLEELAKAAGTAAAEAIAASTPKPNNNNDEAGSDSPTSSSTSSPSPVAPEEGESTTAMAVDGGGQEGDRAEYSANPPRELEQPTFPGPKRARLLLDRPSPPQPEGDLARPSRPQSEADSARPSLPQSEADSARPSLPQSGADSARPSLGGGEAASGSGLYPPGYAGVREVHGDIPGEELSNFESWMEEVGESFAEGGLLDDSESPSWDEHGEHAPELSEDELNLVNAASDKTEIERLVAMGVMRPPLPGEDTSGYGKLTTKIVRDWRKRPGWTRRSRLVAREFKAWTPWTQDLFAPASNLGAVHSFMTLALTFGLELVTIDVKDAYLNVPQPEPVVIEVEAALLDSSATGVVTYVLERLLPGQRVGASAWYGFAKQILNDNGLVNFAKEPTVFRHEDPQNPTALLLHADDGLLAATKKGREKLVGEMRKVVNVQVSEPMREIGDELEFLKRKYVRVPEGIIMYSSNRYAESLFEAFGKDIKEKDAPADKEFLEPDTSEELKGEKQKAYREAVGRLLYLSHSRPDLQFAVCVLSSRMASPTSTSWRLLRKVIGYLYRVPSLGVLMKPIADRACFGYVGKGPLHSGGTIVVESITDADWAGCRRTRKSRTSIQLYAGGSLIGSMVRSQKSVALSSGESEFIALVGGAAEGLYVVEVFKFLLGPASSVAVELHCRTDSAACRGITQRLGCGRLRHIDCGLLWTQAAVKAGRLKVGTISGQDNPADLGTKPLAGPRTRELLHVLGARTEDHEEYGAEDHRIASEKRALSKVVKTLRLEAGGTTRSVKTMLPLMVLLCQICGAESLGLTALAMVNNEALTRMAAALGVGMLFALVFLGIPWTMFRGLCWMFAWIKRTACEKGVQTEVGGFSTKSTQSNLGMSKSEKLFQDEYVDRCTELRSELYNKCRENEAMEQALRQLRAENETLTREVTRLRARRVPEQICVATQRGERYHLPTCGNLRNSSGVKTYTPCFSCLGRGSG